MQENGSGENARRKVLVLGIGNTLHGDDGIGYCLARGIEACGGIEGAEIAAIQELNPGHITVLDGYDVVVFIDAFISDDMPEQARVAILKLDPSRLSKEEIATLVQEIDPHSLNPIRLIVLSYAAQLFKGSAYLVGVRPYRIEFLKGLSTEIKEAIPTALKELRRVLAEFDAAMKASSDCVISWIENNCSKPLLD